MASRPLDFAVSLPSGVSRVDFLIPLVKTVGKLIKSMRHEGGGACNLVVKSKEAAQKLKALGSITVKGQVIELVSRESNLTTVTVVSVPESVPDRLVESTLAEYGPVTKVTRETFPQKELEGIETGNRRVLMEMKKPVPNFLYLRGRRVACGYDGLKRVCLRCNAEGHMRKDCIAPVCVRCAEVGHVSCDALCKRCGGDHAVSSCTVTTWASRVAGGSVSPQQAVPSDVDAAPLGVEQAAVEAAVIAVGVSGGVQPLPADPPTLGAGVAEEPAVSVDAMTAVVEGSSAPGGAGAVELPAGDVPLPDDADSSSSSGSEKLVIDMDQDVLSPDGEDVPVDVPACKRQRVSSGNCQGADA